LTRSTDSARTIALVALALVVDFVVCAKLIPGSTGRGAPIPIIFLGLIYGLITGVTAAGFVLVYRTLRIINFSQVAIGGAGAVLIYNLVTLDHVPFLVALPLGLTLAAAVGAFFEVVFVRRFFGAPRIVLTVFTIIAANFLEAEGRNAIDLLPLFPDRSERSVAQLAGNADLTGRLPFRGFHFTLPGSPTPFGFPHLFAIGIAFLALGALAYFMRRTRLGTAVRALAENSERAALLGISVGTMSLIVWSIAGALSGVGLAMQSLLGQPTASNGFSPGQLLPALAAAVVARMESIWVAVAAGVGLQMFESALSYQQPTEEALFFGACFVLVVIALFMQHSRGERSERGSTSWEGGEEIRRLPVEMADLTSVRVSRWVIGALVTSVAIGFPFLASKGLTYIGSVIALQAIVGISIVVLTGWAGQVSLGQFGLAAVGGVIAASLAARAGLPFWLAIPIAAVLCAALAVLVGIPALRLPGLYLAVATIAFAVAIESVLFDRSLFGWLLPNGAVARPTLPFVNFDDERSMYFLSIVVLALCIYAVRNVRRSRLGRLLIGVRDNEVNVQSAGASPFRLKLAAFGMAGGLAGLAGALLAFQERGVAASQFPATLSIEAFVIALLGGVGSIAGPVVGFAVVNALQTALSAFPEIAAGIAPMVTIVLLYLEPGGLITILARMRDAVLRIIAQRNQLIVPTLFADIDPRSLHLRLVPIAPPDPRAGGLSQIHRRYDMPSTHSDARNGQGPDADAIVFAAAAESVGGDEA
jgi:branched-chain amino acid transport system permease protein